jgi:Tol biopolymer transport system component
MQHLVDTARHALARGDLGHASTVLRQVLHDQPTAGEAWWLLAHTTPDPAERAAYRAQAARYGVVAPDAAPAVPIHPSMPQPPWMIPPATTLSAPPQTSMQQISPRHIWKHPVVLGAALILLIAVGTFGWMSRPPKDSTAARTPGAPSSAAAPTRAASSSGALDRSAASSDPESAVAQTLPITMHHQLLAYAKTMGPGERNIYVRTLDGSIDRELTTLEGVETSPAWSPDGSQIAFTATVNSPHPTKCLPRTAIPSCNVDLYIINADGTNLRRLTSSVAAERMASWSPDGTRIVFQSHGIVDGCPCSPLHIINVDGTGDTPLTGHGTFLSFPSWNQTTNMIAFESARMTSSSLMTIDPETFVVRPLAIKPASSETSAPAWSPNGTEIAFVSGPTTPHGVLAIMGIDGTNGNLNTIQHMSLNVNVDRAFPPTWSPDGQYLAFASDDGSAETLYIVKRDGTGLTQITDNATTYYAPAWSPVSTP